jgi:diguanylate cyclase (GGDEF)-like protein
VFSATTKPLSRRSTVKSTLPFSWLTFAIASLTAAAILLPLVLVPQWFSRQARWDAIRSHVAEVGQLAASVVDGDLHRRLLDPGNYSDDLYERVIAPLVRLHSADPNIFYLYTMVDRDGVAYFVLDTAKSPYLRTKHKLEASEYMERFDLRQEYQDDWLKQIAAGNSYVTPDYETDDYGTFLTAHVPIHDSEGRYSGFIGVDFDLQYYFAREARFRTIAMGSLVAALIFALLIGLLAERYHSAMHHRLREYYDTSIRDSLTGMLNRRGAVAAINKALTRHSGTNATLLIDVDNLKMINDLRGHVAGDAVIALTAETIRQSIREGDDCARLGGDEFIIFAPNCDLEGAKAIARLILQRLSKHEMPLAGVGFSVSIGIAVHEGIDVDFAKVYRDADEAMYQARADGKSRIGLFAPAATAA